MDFDGPDPSQTQTFLSAVGSGFSVSAEEDHWKSCKLPRTDDSSTPMPMHQGTPLVSTDFSLLKSQLPSVSKDGSVLETQFSYYQHTDTPSMYTRNAGYGSGSVNACMHGNFIGVGGPFTPSQWNELKHQTLIFSYIIADVLVPSNLLIPLKKSLYPYGFTSSSTASLPCNSPAWGSFHLRYTGRYEPEPGRCRRTDGKKWRCSWDVVPDQKYCERHINRGRHRSKKPVEGHTARTANSKVVPSSSSMSDSASVKTSGGAANNLAIPWQHQFKNLQFGAVNPSVNRVQDERRLSVFSSTTNLKSNESTFSITKQCVPFAESCFGHVASDSLINPSHRSYYMNSKESGLHIDFTGQETQDQNRPSVITWSDELKSDRIRTQLFMSIPMATSEFSSSSSTTKEKLDLSSLKLSPEFNPIQMGLAVNTDQTKIPKSLGSSIGGPLGEALNNPANNVDSCKNSSSLTLLPEGWKRST